MHLRFRTFIFLVATLLPSAAAAELTVGSVLTDHAVLQRDCPVAVWGRADSGAEVTVQFAGQSKTTTATKAGKWLLKLNPMPASRQSQVLKVTDGKSVIALQDVVVGEVWICSGQSNMQMGISGVSDVKALVPTSERLRCFEVRKTVAMTKQEVCEGNWVVGHPDSAVAFSFAYFLQKEADVPVGIIRACWGSSSLEAWMPRDMTATVPHFKTMMTEFDADVQTQEKIQSILTGKKPWSRADDIFLRRQSNVVYNAMIHPLVPYTCRGLVWYQGERNTQSMFGMLKQPWYSRNSGMLKYGDALKQWILQYRKQWGNDQMCFLTVMLPGYHKPLPTGPQLGPQHPETHSWAWMRESQMKSLELPHTAVANTIDLGDVRNIHPKDKLPIGRRLALLALKKTLQRPLEAVGPMMKSVDVQSGELLVRFDNAQGLKTTDGKAPAGFWIADQQGNWIQADARLQGQTVLLSSSKLKTPRYVRYAFVGKPTVNLVNGAGLPAYPFRNDSFAPMK